jgi:hypothetical protein
MNNLIQLIKEKKATIIDVRSQMEFDQEHFEWSTFKCPNPYSKGNTMR